MNDLHNNIKIDGWKLDEWSNQTRQNVPPRARMMVLYAIAQSFNGRVVGTCNLSENYIGYMTRWGDQASDFEPLGELTVTEVRAIGHELNIPSKWVDKKPDDGLPNSSPDEEKFGFTYAELDKYIRFGEYSSEEIKAKIDARHNKNTFKLKPQPMYKPDIWQ
jgi:NAD+ synthase